MPVEFANRLGLSRNSWKYNSLVNSLRTKKFFTTANEERVYALGETALRAYTSDFHPIDIGVVVLDIHSVLLSMGQLLDAGLLFTVSSGGEAGLLDQNRQDPDPSRERWEPVDPAAAHQQGRQGK